MSERSESCPNDHHSAGAATRDVSPTDSQFLFGYPHVERMSTGVNDPLLASALYLNDGSNQAIFVAVDVIALTKQHVVESRKQIADVTGVPSDHIMISATHTHSGPVTISMLSNQEDDVVPSPDPIYMNLLVHGVVEAAIEAHDNAQPAEIGMSVANVVGLGTNRHDPKGPSISEVPVLVARSLQDQRIICVMCVCSMHPTVMHEDSTLVSGDFPAYARQYLQSKLADSDCPIVYHMGAAGNQSPRHVTRENTFEEAERLGHVLGKALESALHEADFVSNWELRCDVDFVELPLRDLPTLPQAESALTESKRHLENLRHDNAEKSTVRTAECNWFGAAETLSLVHAKQSGHLQEVAQTCLPAEVQIISVGPWDFVGWPGEVFAEFVIELQSSHPNTFVITMANGELQGYLVTKEAVENKTYEATNAMFASPESAQLLASKTIELIEQSKTFRGTSK